VPENSGWILPDFQERSRPTGVAGEL